MTFFIVSLHTTFFDTSDGDRARLFRYLMFFLTLLDSYMVCWTVAVDGPVRTVFEACHKNRMIHTWYFNAHRSGW
jgi:hypothetical protein